MEVKFKKYFLSQFEKLKSLTLKEEIYASIEMLTELEGIEDLPEFKKLSGFANYGRIKIGDYRMGVEVQHKTIIILCIYHSSIVYKYFPKRKKT